jgi:hypothetical protein
MTTLLNYYGETTLICKPNHTETSSLLVKRRQASELGDILAKKIKSLSTNASESGFNQQSPTLSQSSEDVMIDTDARMTIEDSYKQVQQALERLQERLRIEQELSRRESKKQLCQEPLIIPPFLPLFSADFNKPLLKNVRKMEDEMEVFYGEVEYPLLNNIENIGNTETFQFPSLSLPKNKSMRPSKAKQSSMLANLPSRLASLIDDDGESEGSFFTEIRDSLTATRTETQKSDSEMGVATKETGTKKRTLRITEEKKKEHKKNAISRTIEPTKKDEKSPKTGEEKEKTRTKLQKEEDLYSLPVHHGKRQRERRLNRWQLAQTDKLSNGGSSPETSSWETSSESNKKKMIKVPVGPKYQVDMRAVTMRTQERKKPQMKWDPLSQNIAALQNFFDNVRRLLNHNISEEFGIELLNENGSNMNRALEFVRANKTQCLDLITFKSEN